MFKKSCAIFALLLPSLVLAAPSEDELLRSLRANDATVQNLKTRALNVLAGMQDHRDTHFYPPEQRFEVYLSSPARRFTLTRIELRAGEQVLSSTEPDSAAVYAMRMGGAAPIYKGNVSQGPFSLQVVVEGTLPDGSSISHNASMNLSKAAQPLNVELRIRDMPNNRVGLDALEREERP